MSKIDTSTRIKNNLIAAALGLQQCTKTAANVIPLPGTGRFITIGTPAEVQALLAKEYRAAGDQPPLGEDDAIERSKRILRLVDQYVEQQNAENRTTLRMALMHEFERNITPQQLLDIARATGLRGFLHGVGASDARQLLAHFVAAVPAAACGMRREPQQQQQLDQAEEMAGCELAGATDSEGGHHD